MTVLQPGAQTTLYVWIKKSGRSWRQRSTRAPAVTSMIESCVPPEFATTIESPYAPRVSRGHSAMPHGCGPAVGIPATTKVEFAAWKISTRDSDGFVRYSSRRLAE